VKRIVKLVVFIIFIGSQSNSYVYAADSPPAIDYATLKAPNSVIAGEVIEIIFRATDDVGLDLIGPVASYRSLEYPKLFIYFSNCFLTSGDRKDGYWKCKVPTDKTNPLGKYRLILVLTDTVGQHSIEEPISGWTNIANFEMRELTAAEKAAAEKAAAEKAAAEKAAVDNAASEVRITAAKTKYSELSSEIDRLIKQYPSKRSEIELYKKKIALFERIDQVNVVNVELNLAGIESKLVAMRSIYSKIARTITCTKGKVTKKVTDVTPKCPSGYKKK
jgi:hypothetical protein